MYGHSFISNMESERRNALGVSLVYVCLKKTQTLKKRIWVHPILLERTIHGEFHQLIQELKMDENRFQAYFRLNLSQFNHLLHLAAPDLQKMNINCSMSISPEERLAICFR